MHLAQKKLTHITAQNTIISPFSNRNLSSITSRENNRDDCTHCLCSSMSLGRGHPQFTSLAFNFTHQTLVVYTAHWRGRKRSRTWQEHQVFGYLGRKGSKLSLLSDHGHVIPILAWHTPRISWRTNMCSLWSHVFLLHWSDSLCKKHDI